MMCSIQTSKQGSAVVALMLIAVIILGSMLMLHTAAVVTVANTARALETARQNAMTLSRLNWSVREAAQSVFGVSSSPDRRGLADEITAVVAEVPQGDVGVSAVTTSDEPLVPRMFPDWRGAPAELGAPSEDLERLITPELQYLIGPRVAESASFFARFNVSRSAVSTTHVYPVQIEARLVEVPLSRFGLMLYDMPSEVGMGSGSASWPAAIEAQKIGPRGLVARRDPADIGYLGHDDLRPAFYRGAAVLAEAYAYVFSDQYVRRVSDYAGVTHFLQIGAGPANPQLEGGSESGSVYTLDLGQFGAGTLGRRTETKNVAVICGTTPGCHLVLRDSGSNLTPVLLLVVGPDDRTAPPLTVTLDTSISRPLVFIGYHVSVEASSATCLNGAMLLDRDCSAESTTGPISVGHLSCWGGGHVNVDAFRLQDMSLAAESLVPRAIFVATAKSYL